MVDWSGSRFERRGPFGRSEAVWGRFGVVLSTKQFTEHPKSQLQRSDMPPKSQILDGKSILDVTIPHPKRRQILRWITVCPFFRRLHRAVNPVEEHGHGRGPLPGPGRVGALEESGHSSRKRSRVVFHFRMDGISPKCKGSQMLSVLAKLGEALRSLDFVQRGVLLPLMMIVSLAVTHSFGISMMMILDL